MSASSTDRRRAVADQRDSLGVCQWFHYQAYQDVERAVEELRALGIRHLRTGVSWADYHRPQGKQWYDWQMAQFAEFDVLLSVWHTPPSIAAGGTCASPPARLQDFAWFVDQLIDEYGDRFESVELWNEPNNRLKWDFPRFDPAWRLFGDMVREAGHVARARGKRAVLGGMIPVDPHWLALMADYGVLDAVDVVAIHGFPDMWWSDHPNWDWYTHWHGWADKVRQIAEPSGLPVWITETGLATWDLPAGAHGRYELQRQRLQDAAQAPAERVYWYSLVDLDPERPAIEGFHVDENEYHLGLCDYQGGRKPAWYRMRELMARTDGGSPAADGTGAAYPDASVIARRRYRMTTHTTTNHDTIRRWAEDRNARPASVRGTGSARDPGIIRLDFPGYSGDESLEEISWDSWFSKFEDQNLALVYQEKTDSGEKSNFNKLVARDNG